MEITLSVPTYDRYKGIEIKWVDGHQISVAIENNEVIIHANPQGLRTLAIQLLTLAQEGMPSGNHIHLGDSSGLDEGSMDLTLMRK
jgi:hypothetical protein